MAQGRDLLRSGMPFMHQLPARWRPVNHPGDGYLLRCLATVSRKQRTSQGAVAVNFPLGIEPGRELVPLRGDLKAITKYFRKIDVFRQPRTGTCGHALRVPGRLLLAEHHVLQHLVDLPVLTAVKRSWNALRNREGRGLGAASGDRHSSSSQGLPSVGGDTLTHNSTVTNAPKSPPLETNC
ncbi:hypothetical protein HUJ05_011115 [Dendroctonus ponderosae]|nr:hypothetical protein HUJ05_011115 [Dendroctonus ponderosae]